MDDVKDKMKGFMKKVNNPFSSSSPGKFKGQGRTLGSSNSSSSSSNSHNLPSVVSKTSEQKLVGKSKLADKLPETTVNFNDQRKLEGDKKSQDKMPETAMNIDSEQKSENGFDPFNSLITSGKRNPNGLSLKGFECPVCSQVYSSEDEVSAHIDTCLSSETNSVSLMGGEESKGDVNPLQACVSAYVSGKPTDNSMEVVLRLFKNVVKEPDNAKFRKIRIGNPKIKEAIGDVPGGIELLECVGFELIEESGEMWLVMGVPSEEELGLVNDAILLLEPKKKTEELLSIAPAKMKEPVEPKNVDRQIRVFFSVTESVAAKIELPDSFYNLTAAEVKREAETRRKKLEESKLLIPKSYREKQAKAARKRYNKTVVRIQFPDGVVLQAIFSPLEPTGVLYEFVSCALKEPSLEFELLHPVLIKRRVIPRSPEVTLEEEDLVPAALIKFRPIETENIVFTGLCNELLEISEPLISHSAVPLS